MLLLYRLTWPEPHCHAGAGRPLMPSAFGSVVVPWKMLVAPSAPPPMTKLKSAPWRTPLLSYAKVWSVGTRCPATGVTSSTGKRMPQLAPPSVEYQTGDWVYAGGASTNVPYEKV